MEDGNRKLKDIVESDRKKGNYYEGSLEGDRIAGGHAIVACHCYIGL